MLRAVHFQDKQTLDTRSQPETVQGSPDSGWRDDNSLLRQLQAQSLGSPGRTSQRHRDDPALLD